MILFWIFWGIDTIVALVLLYLFFIGLSDGSVSSFNIGLWFLLLLVSIGLLGGSFYLKSKEKLRRELQLHKPFLRYPKIKITRALPTSPNPQVLDYATFNLL